MFAILHFDCTDGIGDKEYEQALKILESEE